MSIDPFELADWFRRHGDAAAHSLTPSDAEPLSLSELLELADGEALQRFHRLSLGYAPSRGDPSLRAAIAALYETVEADEVVTAAPVEAVFLTLRALLSRGDRVVVQRPIYQPLVAQALEMGCEVAEWEVDKRADGTWHFDPDALRGLLMEGTRLLVINWPHNPTGALATRSELEAVIAHARRLGVWILSDEMFRGLEFDTAHRLPAIVDVYERGVSISGLSKTCGLGGLRSGWILVKDGELAARLRKWRDYTSSSQAAPVEVLSLIACRAHGAIVDARRELCARNAGILQEFIESHARTLRGAVPIAGTLAFIECVAESSDEFSAWARDRLQVMIAPSSLFRFDDRHVRFGFGRAGFPGDLERLRSCLSVR